MIDLKTEEWLNDPAMETYLRPRTLFNGTNFENYRNQKGPLKYRQTTQPAAIKPAWMDNDGPQKVNEIADSVDHQKQVQANLEALKRLKGG